MSWGVFEGSGRGLRCLVVQGLGVRGSSSWGSGGSRWGCFKRTVPCNSFWCFQLSCSWYKSTLLFLVVFSTTLYQGCELELELGHFR